MAGNTSAGVTTSALGVGEKPWVLTDGGKEREGRERGIDEKEKEQRRGGREGGGGGRWESARIKARVAAARGRGEAG
jgi:hypothetical protein